MLVSQGYGHSFGLVSQGYGDLLAPPVIPFTGVTPQAAFVLDRGLAPALAFGGLQTATVHDPETNTTAPGHFGVPILSESMTIADDLVSETLNGDRTGLGEIKTTGRKVSGALSLEGQYEGLERFLAAGLGFENPVSNPPVDAPAEKKGGSPKVVTPGVFEHLFELDDNLRAMGWQIEDLESSGADFNDAVAIGLRAGDLKARRGTLYVNGPYGIVAHRGCYVTSLAINGSVNSAVKFDFGLASHSSILFDEEEPFWRPPRRDRRILFSDLTCYLKFIENPGGPFIPSVTSADVIPISAFSVALNNNLATGNQSFRGAGALVEAGLAIDEPFRNTRRDVSGTLSLPRMSDKAREILQQALFSGQLSSETAFYRLRFEFTGSEIVSGQPFRLRIDFPKIQVRAASNLQSAGINPVNLTFTALRPKERVEDSNDNPFALFDYASDLAKFNEMVVTLRNSVPDNLLRPTDLI